MPQQASTYPLPSWQIILLFTALGTLAPKLESIAPLAIGLLLIASFLKIKTPFKLSKILIPGAFYLSGLALGWFAAQMNLTPPAVLPDWAMRDQPARIIAKVDQVEALPEARIRVILSDVRPYAENQKQAHSIASEVLLPARLTWTWAYPPKERPLPGQTIITSLNIKQVRGMYNPGTFNLEEYWLEKGVGFRAWTKGAKGEFVVAAPEPFWQLARSWVEQKMLSALLPPQMFNSNSKFEHENERSEESEKTASPELTGGKAIIPALLMGNKYYLTYPQQELFAAASLSHSLALSGLHLGLMAGIGAALAIALCSLKPQIMLRIPRPKLAVFLAAPLVIIYLWLGGITPSLLRAALMFACMAWLLWRGRPHVIMDGLFWAVLIMLLLNPLALHDLRLQLSAACIAAIGLSLPYSLRIAKWIFPKNSRPARFLRGLSSLLLVSLSIQLVLLPLQTWSFGQTTPWFVFNLIWLPVLSTVVFPLSVLGLAFSVVPGLEGAARFIFDLAAVPGNCLFSSLAFLDNANLLYAPAAVRPAAQASLAYWLILFILAGLGARLHKTKQAEPAKQDGRKQSRENSRSIRNFSRRIRFFDQFKAVWSETLSKNSTLPRLNPLLLVLLVSAWLLMAYYLAERWQAEYPPGPRLSLIDVGQGQAVLFEGTEGQRILADGGGVLSSSFDIGKSVLAPALTLNRAPRLTAIINTHPDKDHIDGLLFLIKKFQIKELYLGQGIPKKEYGEFVERLLIKHGFTGERSPRLLRAGDTLTLDKNRTLLVLHPPLQLSKGADPKIVIRKANSASIVLRLKDKSRGLALICGDIDQGGIRTLLKTMRGIPDDKLESEVLILPHHGSKHGFHLEFYDAVNPELALVSAGYGNQWGFPARIIRDELASRGIPLYSTSDYGQINIEWNRYGGRTVTLSRPEAVFKTNYR